MSENLKKYTAKRGEHEAQIDVYLTDEEKVVFSDIWRKYAHTLDYLSASLLHEFISQNDVSSSDVVVAKRILADFVSIFMLANRWENESRQEGLQ